MNSHRGIQIAAKTIEEQRQANLNFDSWDLACTIVHNLTCAGWVSQNITEEDFQEILNNLPFGPMFS